MPWSFPPMVFLFAPFIIIITVFFSFLIWVFQKEFRGAACTGRPCFWYCCKTARFNSLRGLMKLNIIYKISEENNVFVLRSKSRLLQWAMACVPEPVCVCVRVCGCGCVSSKKAHMVRCYAEVKRPQTVNSLSRISRIQDMYFMCECQSIVKHI